MSKSLKIPFAFGVILNVTCFPPQLAALLVLMMPSDNPLLSTAQAWSIVLSLILGPVLIISCFTNQRFASPSFDTSNFKGPGAKVAIWVARKLEKGLARLNNLYEAFWTVDNRWACGLLALLTMGFAFTKLTSLFTKEAAAMLTVISIAAFITALVALIFNSGPKKAKLT